jgi:hypothetical protein
MITTNYRIEITTFEGSEPSAEVVREILLDEIADCEAINVYPAEDNQDMDQDKQRVVATFTLEEVKDLLNFRFINCGCEAEEGKLCPLCQKIRPLLFS